jgi:SAM-dependent methyltransferase
VGTSPHVPTEWVNLNLRRWQEGDYVAQFAERMLRPVEVVILARFREALAGRVLEVGCGAGRVFGYLLALGAEVHAIDISPRMVRYCRERYPQASVGVGDMTNLSASVEGSFDAIIAAYNVLDVLDDAARRRVLSDMRERLVPDGLLVFSSHNLAAATGSGDNDAGITGSPAGGGALTAFARLDRRPSDLVRLARRLPARLRNRRRLARLERREGDHAILNDEALDYGLLHYYIGRDDQARQLQELGFELLECLDLEGETVGAGEVSRSPELHYVTRRSPAWPADSHTRDQPDELL